VIETGRPVTMAPRGLVLIRQQRFGPDGRSTSFVLPLSSDASKDEGWRVRKDGTQFWADVVTTALPYGERTTARVRQSRAPIPLT
jgi:hypothetical protein